MCLIVVCLSLAAKAELQPMLKYNKNTTNLDIDFVVYPTTTF